MFLGFLSINLLFYSCIRASNIRNKYLVLCISIVISQFQESAKKLFSVKKEFLHYWLRKYCFRCWNSHKLPFFPHWFRAKFAAHLQKCLDVMEYILWLNSLWFYIISYIYPLFSSFYIQCLLSCYTVCILKAAQILSGTRMNINTFSNGQRVVKTVNPNIRWSKFTISPGFEPEIRDKIQAHTSL